MRNYVSVDLSRLVRNYHAIQTAVAPAVIAAVVKADAYGHGALPVASALSKAGCAHFCVATVEEGVELRQAGIQGEVFVLGSLGTMEDGALAAHHLTPVIHSLALLEEWAAYARRLGRRLPCHLEFNTGMNRLGISLHSLPEAIRMLTNVPELELRGLATHFASAEDYAGDATETQLVHFSDTLARFHSAGIKPTWLHIANSAAAAYRDDACLTMIRPGLALYGYLTPAEGAVCQPRFHTEPILEWRAKILDVRALHPGDRVGYGGEFVAPRETLTAVVAAGYADGWTRDLTGIGEVRIAGCACPLVGRVSMDTCVVDISRVEHRVHPGEEALLLGPGQDATAIAAWRRTIPYEVLCGISRRVTRRYVS